MSAQASGGHGSFRQSWTIQLRVIWALLLRESLTRYGRHNIGFLWLFVEPMLFTLGVRMLREGSAMLILPVGAIPPGGRGPWASGRRRASGVYSCPCKSLSW